MISDMKALFTHLFIYVYITAKDSEMQLQPVRSSAAPWKLCMLVFSPAESPTFALKMV